ncbi:hypothetical protein C8J57DRAFT_1238800 [Mycena rebaudengoi]|nr:hypothetical protein C8J57DRAFT_1238800 [Mycena rebaudengoi]
MQELDVYAALASLAVIVPRLYTVVAPPNRAWAGLVLEDAGTELGDGSQRWEEIDLTPEDKHRLYGAPSTLHHSCSGPVCPELLALHKALALSNPLVAPGIKSLGKINVSGHARGEILNGVDLSQFKISPDGQDLEEWYSNDRPNHP